MIGVIFLEPVGISNGRARYRKNKQYISLANHDNSSLNTIKENVEEIAKILQSYPAYTLTFLEIPVYSIYELRNFLRKIW
jgi:hypothetical protein